MTDLEARRQKLKARRRRQGVRLTPLAFMIKAAVIALQEFPVFNTSMSADGKSLVYKKYFHIGFAADTPNGLIVPVIRDVDQKDVMSIARSSANSARGARRQADRAADAGRHVHRVESRRHRRHDVHADHQPARGRDPRRGRSKMQPVWNGRSSCRG